jgi:hypothetical protein
MDLFCILTLTDTGKTSSVMPALTRSAARRLAEAAPDAANERALALRESVTQKADAVWAHRGGVDLYTGASKSSTDVAQVDHCLEVQLGELALVRAFGDDRAAGTQSMATAQATELLRDALNGLDNLNVTSKKVNQAKRGPITAAINRLRDERLRSVPIRQLVKQGRGSWMLEDGGPWPAIERAVVAAYDAADAALADGRADALPAAAALVEGSMVELGRVLQTLHIR